MASFQESGSIEASSSDTNPLMDRYKFNFSDNRLDDGLFKSLDEDFTSLLKKRGKLYLATKLRNISLTKPMLKYFSQKLAADLNQQDSENLTPISYTARIEPLKEGDNMPQIKVVIESHDSKKEKKSKTVVYTAVFFSWQFDNSAREELDLPYLFSMGAEKVLSSVHNLFEEYFGCKIIPVALSQREMRWLMILILHLMSEENIRPMQVTYQLGSKGTKMELTFSVAVLREIWTKVHNEDVSEITYEEVSTLMNGLEEHILETIRIDLSFFNIKRISVVDKVTIDVKGKFCMASEDIIDLTYRFLNGRLKVA